MAPFDRSVERTEKAEIRQFHREMAESLAHLVQLYEDAGEQNPIKNLRELRGDVRAGLAERVGSMNPEHISWLVLTELASEGRSEVALDLWKKTLNHAADHLLAGEAAYEAIRLQQDSPLEKARFKALVADFSHAWQPNGGIEWSLIHQLAQSQILYERWLRKHVDRMTFEGISDHDLKSQSRGNGKGKGTWIVPRVTEAEAIEQAQQMADRFQKACLRIIRTLRDLRRYAPTVVIQNAEQVNLADQQINMQSR